MDDLNSSSYTGFDKSIILILKDSEWIETGESGEYSRGKFLKISREVKQKFWLYGGYLEKWHFLSKNVKSKPNPRKTRNEFEYLKKKIEESFQSFNSKENRLFLLFEIELFEFLRK